MKIQQISIFVENKPGRLAEITRLLADNDVNLRALSISDTTKFGILRVIVDKPTLAVEVLKNEGLTVSYTDVLAISISDNPGGLALPLEILNREDIAIEYMYAFIGSTNNQAYVIIRVEDNEKAIAALSAANIPLLNANDVYTL
ncbi:MAG: ACT domain-containing protein [Ruminococcaceae bacterium]|nr:ACT domain-containing protein [Oscillospiraceae bacterium]